MTLASTLRGGFAAAGSALLLTGTVAAVPAAAMEPAPFVRVTFMCKMPVNGTTGAAPGQTFQAGDYIFRIREEAGRTATDWTAGVGGAGMFSGTIASKATEFYAVGAPVAGVSVRTSPEANLYKGTASTNENPCGDVVEIPVLPTTADECKDGGWLTFADKFKNQGQCVAFVNSHKADA